MNAYIYRAPRSLAPQSLSGVMISQCKAELLVRSVENSVILSDENITENPLESRTINSYDYQSHT